MLLQASPSARCILLFYWQILIIYPGARAVSEAASSLVKLREKEAQSTLIVVSLSSLVAMCQQDAFKPLRLL